MDSEPPAYQLPTLLNLIRRRNATAKTLDLPPYYVLTNSVVASITIARPNTIAELSSIKGIGPRKLKQFGVQIVELISNNPAQSLGDCAKPPGEIMSVHRVAEDLRRAYPLATPGQVLTRQADGSVAFQDPDVGGGGTSGLLFLTYVPVPTGSRSIQADVHGTSETSFLTLMDVSTRGTHSVTAPAAGTVWRVTAKGFMDSAGSGQNHAIQLKLHLGATNLVAVDVQPPENVSSKLWELDILSVVLV